MVEISLSGSGEDPGWATAPGYSTTGISTAASPWTVSAHALRALVENSQFGIRQACSEKYAGHPERKGIGLELKARHSRQGELEIADRRTVSGEIELCLPT